ncbi:MAG: hypothetical protein AAF368_12705, partial [Planctomycetota bacterium]
AMGPAPLIQAFDRVRDHFGVSPQHSRMSDLRSGATPGSHLTRFSSDPLPVGPRPQDALSLRLQSKEAQ